MKRGYILLILLLLHFILLNSFFPVTEIFSHKFITTTDYPIHYVSIEFFKHNLYRSPIISMSYLGDLKLISFFIPVLYAQKIYIFLALFIMPLLFYISSKEFYNSKKAGLIALIFGIFLVNLSLIFKEYLLWGVFPYVFSCSITLVAISNIIAYQKYKIKRNAILGLIFLLWSFMVHPMVLLYYLVFGIAFFFFYSKRFISLVFVIIIFLFPLLIHGHPSCYYQASGFHGFYYLLSEKPLFRLFFILGLLALTFFFSKEERKFWSFYLTLLFLLIFYLGLLYPFKVFQLQRIMLFYFILILLSIGLFLKENWKFALGVLIIVISLVSSTQQIREAYTKHLDFGLSKDMQDLKAYFDNNKHQNVWFEFSSNLIYGGNSVRFFSYWLLPKEAIIIRKIPEDVKKPKLYFCDGQFEDISIDKASWGLILNLTREFNISHIVYWSNASKVYFNSKLNHTCFEKVCVASIR